MGFPEITIEASSSKTLPGRLEQQIDDTEAHEGGTVGQEQQKGEAIGDDIEIPPTERYENADRQSGQCKNNDDTTKFPVSKSQDDIETQEDFKGEMPSHSSVCSGRFSSDFDIKNQEDVISAEPSCRDDVGGSKSVEKVVNRWQCSDNEEGADSKEPRPKRSAIRRNSLEGGKRKSVTFVPTVNGEVDVADTMDRESAGYVDEKETERLVSVLFLNYMLVLQSFISNSCF